MATENRAEKAATIEKIYELFGNHKQIILANFTNVGSSQIHQIRKTLRAYGAHFVINKNTLTKKVLKMRTEGIEEDEFKHLEQSYGGKVPELKTLIPLLKDKIALIFTDAPVYELKQKLEANKVPTEARVGALAPIDFTVPAGQTGLDPSQINFFHALNISTKINKGQIEITKDFKVCTKGKKIKASEAALLKKLNLKPFEYGLKLNSVYDEGSILPEEIINFNPASLLEKIQDGVKNIAGLSLAAGYPIEATVPIIIGNGFRNIAALSLESGYFVFNVDSKSQNSMLSSAQDLLKHQSPLKRNNPNQLRSRKKPPKLPNHQRKKKKTWTWVVSSTDFIKLFKPLIAVGLMNISCIISYNPYNCSYHSFHILLL